MRGVFKLDFQGELWVGDEGVAGGCREGKFGRLGIADSHVWAGGIAAMPTASSLDVHVGWKWWGYLDGRQCHLRDEAGEPVEYSS